ncbi:ADP-ribosylation factor GTPase-activating protein AGD4-like isoform X2 [Pyrus x bretschneideri]|uniref:ADP-ribosylation factor GTPase-activating protein AGD4-like isoform X2 n=1 Tax=Pyrus x bretschneideri TaxID=225117 RepID=UPI00202E5291|nr:ADP-ribosylation factor GTPase-activating protein AGD4-like isoform X2 [Pyrus x bretschneideri]
MVSLRLRLCCVLMFPVGRMTKLLMFQNDCIFTEVEGEMCKLVWEPIPVDLFRNLGNAYCNSVWEGTLLLQNEKLDGWKDMRAPVFKPGPKDAAQHKEIYIQAKTTSIEDGGRQSALERAMEMGAITDEELFILLARLDGGVVAQISLTIGFNITFYRIQLCKYFKLTIN